MGCSDSKSTIYRIDNTRKFYQADTTVNAEK